MLFLHNSYGTLEFPDCGNLMRADGMENLRWANMELFMPFRETNKIDNIKVDVFLTFGNEKRDPGSDLF